MNHNNMISAIRRAANLNDTVEIQRIRDLLNANDIVTMTLHEVCTNWLDDDCDDWEDWADDLIDGELDYEIGESIADLLNDIKK